LENVYTLEQVVFNDIRCSQLYSIQAQNIGTRYVESLTSYICRLATEHNIPPGTLINKILAPKMDKKYLIKSAQRGGNRFYDGARSINGYCKNALDFSQVLGTLTLRNDLIDLTLMKWKNIVSLRGLLEKHLSWCPNCIFDWKGEGSQIYYPLSWYLSSMQVCLIYNTYLSNICPYCSKKLPILHINYINGYCPLCKGWLGEYQRTPSITNQDIFNSKNIDKIVTEVLSGESVLMEDEEKRKEIHYRLGLNPEREKKEKKEKRYCEKSRTKKIKT
jgi:hypothetical protein